MKRRSVHCRTRGRGVSGATLRGLLLAVNGVLVADDMAHSPDAGEGYDKLFGSIGPGAIDTPTRANATRKLTWENGDRASSCAIQPAHRRLESPSPSLRSCSGPGGL
jgi:hypothetical protein